LIEISEQTGIEPTLQKKDINKYLAKVIKGKQGNDKTVAF
jgi:hypothetical protein